MADEIEQWHRIAFTSYADLYNRSRPVLLEFGDAWIAAGAPNDATLYSTWEGTSVVYYFSPGCLRFFEHLLQPYSGSPCAKPRPSKHLHRLAGASDSDGLLKA